MPTASIHVASARSRPARPGRRSAEVRVEDRDQVEVRRAQVAHGLRAADEDLLRRCGSRARPRAVARTGTGASAPPTPRRARRRRGGSRSPRRRTRAHRPGASHTTHRTAPLLRAGARRRTPRTRPARRTRGRPAPIPYPGSGAKRNPRRVSRQRPHQPRRPPLGTGAHDLDRRPAPGRRRDLPRRRAPLASDDGHSAESTHTAPAEPRALQRRRRGRGSTALAPRDAPGWLSRDTTISPDVRHRREHRRPRPHDDVERARPAIVEPRPVPRALVPPDEHRRRAPRTPPRSPPRSPARGTASGTSTIARRPPAETRRDGLHGDRDLVLGRRPDA